MSGSGVERNLERGRERLERDRETETDRDRQIETERSFTATLLKDIKINYVAYLLQCCSRYKIKSLNHYNTAQCTKLIMSLISTALSRVKVFKRDRQTDRDTQRDVT